MKIYLSYSTAARGGGATLKGTLKHLDRQIQTAINESAFKSSFDEVWFTLAYPPMYMSPGVLGMETDFMNSYNKLPNSRLNRRYRSIDVTVKAPEFSEHFDKEDQQDYSNKLSIAEEYKGIDELSLSGILIDKYLEAVDIISKKIKKGDEFNSESLRKILLSVKSKLTVESLHNFNRQEKVNIHDESVKRALDLRETRRSKRAPKNKVIRDLRVYYNNLPDKALYPYDYQYVEIFRNILASKQFKCPDYHHLYVQVAESEEEALKNSFALENWYANGISTLDYKEYLRKPENQKADIVFEVIVNGLKDLVEVDGLDGAILNETVTEIKKNKLETELTFGIYENKKYQLKITYLSRSMEEECPVFFHLYEKETGRNKKTQIGKADISQIYLWLQKVTLTNKVIRIRSSEAVRSQVWLRDKPRKMEFEISKLLM